jgi:hypothetical protein
MRKFAVVAAVVSAIAVASAVMANLPVASDNTVVASGAVVIPGGTGQLDLYADGAAFVTFRKDGAAVVRMELRSGTARSFTFKPGYYDSLYVGLDTATEVIVTWVP